LRGAGGVIKLLLVFPDKNISYYHPPSLPQGREEQRINSPSREETESTLPLRGAGGVIKLLLVEN